MADLQFIADRLLQAWMLEQSLSSLPRPANVRQIGLIYAQYRDAAVGAASRQHQKKAVAGMLRMAHSMLCQQTVATAAPEQALSLYGETFFCAENKTQRFESAQGCDKALHHVCVRDGQTDAFFKKASLFYMKPLAARLMSFAIRVPLESYKEGQVFWESLAWLAEKTYSAHPDDKEKRLFYLDNVMSMGPENLASVFEKHSDRLGLFCQAQNEQARQEVLSACYELMTGSAPVFAKPIRGYETMIALADKPALGAQRNLLLMCGVWGPYEMATILHNHYAMQMPPPMAMHTMADLYETSAGWAFSTKLHEAPLFNILCERADALADQMMGADLSNMKTPSRLTRRAFLFANRRGEVLKKQVAFWIARREAQKSATL